MRHVRWLVRICSAAGAAAVLLILVAATPSWAPHVAQLQVTPSQARPGQEVTVYGPRGYGPTNPVEVRWGSPTGPVLGTFQPNTESYAQWGPGPITIPADAKAGTVDLFATQILTPGETYIRGIPSQASIQIVTEGGAAPVVSGPSSPATHQPAVGLAEEQASSTGHLVLVALGVAGAALFLGGGAAILVARRPRPAQPSPAQPVGSGQ